MTYQELQNILRMNQLGQGVPVAPSIDQIISGIQSQYQPQFMPVEYSQPRFVQEYSAPEQFSFQQPSFNYQPPSQLMPTTLANAGSYNLLPTGGQFVKGGQGAQRFATGPQSFEQQTFTPVAQSAPVFTPGAFDIEQYRYKAPETVTEVIDAISDGGGSADSAGGGGVSTGIDGTGLTQSANVTPGQVGALSALISALTGLPVNVVTNMLGKQNIADEANAQNYANDVANNFSVVGEQMGLDPSDPANAAAISAAIDSLISSPTGQTTATTGETGTGGAAAQAAAEAAAAASSMGLSDAAIGAASQAAANAALGGASVSDAIGMGVSAAASEGSNVGGGYGAGGYGANDNFGGFGFGGDIGGDTGGGSIGGGNAAGGAGNSGDGGTGDSSTAEDGGGGGGGSKIICTAMNHAYGFGSFRNAIWIAYADKHLTKAHEVGYHTLFLPLVDFGFKRGDAKSKLVVRKILEWGTRHRSMDIRAEMRGTKRDSTGRAIRFVFEPLCYFVGKLKGY